MKFTQEISKTSAHSLFTLQVYTFARDLKHSAVSSGKKKGGLIPNSKTPLNFSEASPCFWQDSFHFPTKGAKTDRNSSHSFLLLSKQVFQIRAVIASSQVTDARTNPVLKLLSLQIPCPGSSNFTQKYLVRLCCHCTEVKQNTAR